MTTIDLHDYERIDRVAATRLRRGDQWATGHWVTDVLREGLISHVDVILDGDYTRPHRLTEFDLVEVIVPAGEPPGYRDRHRKLYSEPIALPPVTGAD